MSKSFHETRRQQFLNENFYFSQMKRRANLFSVFNEELCSPDVNAEDVALLRQSLCSDHYELFSLEYTAGAPIEQLRSNLTSIIEAYEQYQVALATYEQIPHIAPLGMRNIGDYERCMQLVGLCYLLHRRDLLPRIAALQDPGYAGEDMLYEELLDYGLPDRFEVDTMFHVELYDHLVHAMYAETDEESINDLKQYLKSWYPSFKYVPWHDGHLRINGTDGDYFGYWAFEAGAVACLLDLDDTGIDHLVYPKDLVTWARANKHLADVPMQTLIGRCEAGQPCPQTGYWFTPAQADSRRYFKQGDTMPAVASDYGTTIWQWDSDQE